MTDHRVPFAECPSCHTRMDGALNATGPEAPEAGDPTICGYCAEIMVFTADPDTGLGLRSATSEEIVQFLYIPAFTAARNAVVALIARRR